MSGGLGSLASQGERDAVEDVMARPEFQYPKSLMERVGDWFADLFGRAADELPVTSAPPGTFTGGAGSFVGWLLIMAALAAVVALVALAVRNWMPRVRDEQEPLSEVEVEHRRTASQWAGDAEGHEAAADWKLAMRARYRELVRTLVDRRQVADLAGRTTRELLEDLSHTTPDAARDFESACLLFELPWYADVPTGPEENRRIRKLSTDVLAAAVAHEFDPAPGVSAARIPVGTGEPQ